MEEEKKIWWNKELREEWKQNGMMGQESGLSSAMYDSSGLMPQTDAFREFASREMVKAEANAYAAGLKAQVELAREAEMQKLKTEGAVNRAMRLADISSRKALQLSDIIVGKDGEISIFKEQFGEPLRGNVGLRIGTYCSRFTCCDVDDGILYIPFFLRNGEGREIYLAVSQFSDKTIRTKFDRAGIEFGFGRVKEAEFRMKLIRKVIVFAPEVGLPYQHGWIEKDDELDFISPEMLTWQDMVKLTYC